ncbi:MAG: uL15 family ribosomal protein [Candidatus Taylorbacteria bacterium]|nr:uL15 family ribosomal protein [Candidatus Taylorbacteria bacterium]
MDLSQLQPNTPRKSVKRVGRGGKRGTYSGGGTKGQKSRAGAGVKPGFRGGDNRIWQLFPKQRGASKKPGGKGPHRKHRYFRLHQDKPVVFNLGFFNQFTEDELISPALLNKKGFLSNSETKVKILGDGELGRKLNFEGFDFSKSARQKVSKAGGTIK